jgi:carboxylesterase
MTREANGGGGTGPRSVPTEPFFWVAGEPGCLLVHGFTSTPYEMRHLGERLRAAGYTVSAVRLAGHGTRPEDLERTTRRDWYRSARDGLEEIAARCETRVVVGSSLGALLALRLAEQRAREVDALVLLAVPLELANRRTDLARLLAPFAPLLPRRLRFLPKGESDIADDAARGVHPAYREMPLRAVAQLVALRDEVRGRLGRVRQPTLVLHGAGDHTAPVENVELLRQLPGLRRVVLLPASRHVIGVDRDKDRLADEVIRFLSEEFRGAGRSPSAKDVSA